MLCIVSSIGYYAMQRKIPDDDLPVAWQRSERWNRMFMDWLSSSDARISQANVIAVNYFQSTNLIRLAIEANTQKADSLKYAEHILI